MQELANSSILILRPQEAFAAWLMSQEVQKQLSEEMVALLKDMDFADLYTNATVISMPAMQPEDADKLEAYVNEKALTILSAELARWGITCDDMSNDDAQKALVNWFELSFHSQAVVLD